MAQSREEREGTLLPLAFPPKLSHTPFFSPSSSGKARASPNRPPPSFLSPSLPQNVSLPLSRSVSLSLLDVNMGKPQAPPLPS